MEQDNPKQEEKQSVEQEQAAQAQAPASEGEANEAKPKAKKKKSEEGAKLQEQIQRLEKENKEQADRYLRMLAEYDNYRKRTTADMERQKVVGISSTLTAIFPVIDSVNRALEVLEGDDKAKQGILQIKKQFEAGLAKIGVEQIPALGEEFNPEVHNAVMQEENSEQAGKVVQVFQEGYKYKDFVIRPAMVKVAV